jgi:hypothetical protein
MIQTMTPYTMNAVVSALKTLITTAPGSTVHLFQNNVVPTPANVVADFTEATFDGYAAKSVTVMFGPARYADGSFQVFAFEQWQMTGSTTPNTVYGAYILDPAGNLLLAARFTAPVPMVDAFSNISTQFHVGIAQNGLVGDVDVEP